MFLMPAHRWLLLASVLWLGTLFAMPTWCASPFAFAFTVILIASNLVASVLMLVRKGRLLILLPLVQVALFGVLNYQVYRTFGADQFTFDREPQSIDWATYTLAHVVRAVDLCDAIEAYNIHMQPITHNSHLTGLILLALHLVTDFFVLALLFRLSKKLFPTRPPNSAHEITIGMKFIALCAVGLMITSVGFLVLSGIRQYSLWQQFVWGIDNTLRTLDVGDMFQIFGWRLHDIDGDWILATITVLFRFSLGVVLGVIFQHLWVRHLGGFGMTIDDLAERLETTPQLGDTVLALSRFGPQAREYIPAILKRLPRTPGEELPMIFAGLDQIEPGWERLRVREVVPVLIDTFKLRWLLSDTVGQVIGRIGRPGVPEIVNYLRKSLPEERTRECEGTAAMYAIHVVGSEAVEAVPLLIEILENVECQRLWAHAANALGAIGPAATAGIPTLVKKTEPYWDASLIDAANRALKNIRGSV